MLQILQRQCDSLQSTTTNMELEVEGNSQSTTAMKNRVRLLRKESRKQVQEAECLASTEVTDGRNTSFHNMIPGTVSVVNSTAAPWAL